MTPVLHLDPVESELFPVTLVLGLMTPALDLVTLAPEQVTLVTESMTPALPRVTAVTCLHFLDQVLLDCSPAGAPCGAAPCNRMTLHCLASPAVTHREEVSAAAPDSRTWPVEVLDFDPWATAPMTGQAASLQAAAP